jgi:hypothetical protein
MTSLSHLKQPCFKHLQSPPLAEASCNSFHVCLHAQNDEHLFELDDVWMDESLVVEDLPLHIFGHLLNRYECSHKR